jgi:hypothetical protein
MTRKRTTTTRVNERQGRRQGEGVSDNKERGHSGWAGLTYNLHGRAAAVSLESETAAFPY